MKIKSFFSTFLIPSNYVHTGKAGISKIISKPNILHLFQNSIDGGSIKIVDLSHKVSKSSPTWTGGCGFSKKEVLKYGNDLFCVQDIKLSAAIGTHMDSPAHLFEGSNDVSSIDISSFFTPICIVDIRDKVRKDSKYKMTVEDVESYEKTFGILPPNSLLVALTGWSKYWHDTKLYRNVDQKGVMCFPGITEDVVKKYIVKLNGIGIDTLSPDGGDMSYGFPVHEKVLGSKKWILENLNNLEKMPAKGGIAISLPMNFEGCTESPSRVIGLYEEGELNIIGDINNID